MEMHGDAGFASTRAIPADVKQAFEAFPAPVRARLRDVRDLIYRAVEDTDAIGEIEETLKWGQPSYLPKHSGIGMTVRLGTLKAAPDRPALFFNCQTRLIDTFREIYPSAFEYEGNRAMALPASGRLPEAEIRHCVALALTYHQWK